MQYPRTVVLESPKLKKLLEEKQQYILDGRRESNKLEQIEAEMESIDKQIADYEKQADTSDIDERAKVITEEMNVVFQKMEELKKELFDRGRAQVPPELYQQYEAKVKEKEETERTRNKFALKAQKYTDRIIPIARNLMKPFLQDEYEDFDSLLIEDNQVVGKIFNHLVDWKAAFAKKKE